MTRHADVRLWSADDLSKRPMAFGSALNVLDLRGSPPGSITIPAACGLILVASERARGAWAMFAGATPIAVLPPGRATVPAGDRPCRLHIWVGKAPDGAARAEAEAAAAWAREKGWAAGIEGGSSPAALALVARLGPAPPVGSGSVLLDLRPEPEGLEPSDLALAGVPVVTSLAEMTALSPETYRALARPVAPVSLAPLLNTARAKLAHRLECWAEGPAPHVLVITGEADNLVDIRVHLPFRALHRAGAIAGYTVLRQKEFAFSTHPIADELRFGAIWVQRSADPSILLLLRTLRVEFVYDLDDLLSVSPSYRPEFTAESRETVRAMLAASTIVSCATETLASNLAIGMDRVVLTPNLASQPARLVRGPARTVVWASSDRPALAGARRAVTEAVRDFCRGHRLRLVCVGASPAPELTHARLDIETTGLLPYPAYQDRLLSATPGILIGPLETDADAETQAFVDSKSDIKVIEARQAGLVGVFSRATPYLTSDLAPDVLCKNSYAGWLDGLERARSLCALPRPVPPWPAWRDLDRTGLAPWAAALRRATANVSVGDVRDALMFVAAQAAVSFPGPDRFDEVDYLERQPDVAQAVASGALPSGYAHYVAHGKQEGRTAKALSSPDEAGSAWFAALLHRTGRLERAVVSHDRRIAEAVARRSLDGASDGVDWEPGGRVTAACPVCDAEGPHPVRLRQAGQVLARCEQCDSLAAVSRVEHAYGDDPLATVLLQLYLEQNAGVHQQTKLLFETGATGSVLDVGCSFGFTVDFARRQLGWRAVGVDPSYAARAGREALGADIRPAVLTSRMPLGDRFAVVTASEVIEHVADPYRLLRLLKSRLAPGGALVLTTPDATALAPGIGRARTLAITAPRVHLVLFTPASLTLALRRAGFQAIRVRRSGDGFIASASDRPKPPPDDADSQHVTAYQDYLKRLVTTASPGSPLWNGAAGRLLALLEPSAPLDVLAALTARIAAGWSQRFGIDFDRVALPEPVAGEAAPALAARQPLNLGPVLLRLASIARRSGQKWHMLASAAERIADHAERTLAAANMIDHDLRQTAARARAMLMEF